MDSSCGGGRVPFERRSTHCGAALTGGRGMKGEPRGCSRRAGRDSPAHRRSISVDRGRQRMRGSGCGAVSTCVTRIPNGAMLAGLSRKARRTERAGCDWPRPLPSEGLRSIASGRSSFRFVAALEPRRSGRSRSPSDGGSVGRDGAEFRVAAASVLGSIRGSSAANPRAAPPEDPPRRKGRPAM